MLVNDFAAPSSSGTNWVDHDSPLDLSTTDLFATTNDAVRLEPWSARLPRVRREDINLLNAFYRIDQEFGASVVVTVCRALARYANLSADEITFDAGDARLYNFDLFADDKRDDQVLMTFAVDGNAAPLGVAAEAHFCAEIIDRVLGGGGAPPEELRPLTATELAVLEFLALHAAHDLATHRRDRTWPSLKLISINAPGAGEQVAPGGGVVLNVTACIGGRRGFLRILLSGAALNAFNHDDARHRRSHVNLEPHDLSRCALVLPELFFKLLIGESQVAADDVAQLECGDVLLIDQAVCRLSNNTLNGTGRVALGNCRAASILGRLCARGDHHGGRGEELMLIIEEFVSPETQTEESRLEINGSEQQGAESREATSLIEELSLVVRVELGARSARLGELARLRRGQILDLGCRATDLVNLTVDGRRIARGELIEVEGQLGVRLTQVAGA